MEKNKTKKPNVRSINRKNTLKAEIYDILRHEAHKIMVENNTREDGFVKRLIAMEAGVPQAELEFIKTAISQIRYKQNQMQWAMEGLLNFFSITKDFFGVEKWVKVSDSLPGRTGYYQCRVNGAEECKLLHSWESGEFGLLIDGKWKKFDVLEWKDAN